MKYRTLTFNDVHVDEPSTGDAAAPDFSPEAAEPPSLELLDEAGDADSGCIPIRPAPRQVMELAALIEPDLGKLALWYRNIGIAELGAVTAMELISAGRAGELIEFLRSIREGTRD